MNRVKIFLKSKGFGFYVAVLTTFMTVVSFINYMGAANDSYGYDMILICLYVALTGLNILFLFRDLGDAGNIIMGILTGFMFGMFIKVRFTYFATGLMGISQEGVAGGMLSALLLLLLIAVINIFGAFFIRDRREG